jgi:hypothetical protein
MYATQTAPATPRTVQKIRLAGQSQRWEEMVRYYRAHGMPTSAKRAERMLRLARRAEQDDAMIALVTGAEPAAAAPVDAAEEYDRAWYEGALRQSEA